MKRSGATVFLVWVACACGPTAASPDGGEPGGGPDADACTSFLDSDGDGRDNVLEGCQEDPPRDSDGDGTPDWLDEDADNDGVDDRDEDRNGDGKVGRCEETCDSNAECAEGYFCSRRPQGGEGLCVSPLCLDGETDPLNPDTDGDGVSDASEGTFVCNPPGEHNPNGLKRFKLVDSADAIKYSVPNWQIAIEESALHGPVPIASAHTLDSAYVFDLTDPEVEVAGFLVSRARIDMETDAFTAAQQAIQRLGVGRLPGITEMTQRASGTRETSLDGYDTVLRTTLVVRASELTEVTDLRKRVVAQLLAPRVGLDDLKANWTGATGLEFAIVFQTLFRSDQVIYMGAVARRQMLDDPKKATGFHVDDLANGTGLTYSGNGEEIECQQFVVDEVPKADIIWVVDGSGSMSSDRSNVATNATKFFQNARSAGLDFRMGVTDMDDGSEGRFARRSGAASDDDRWILPDELGLFQQDINQPEGPGSGDGGSEHGLTQGREAMARHLPRDANDPHKVRPDAKLVVVYVTDEKPQELKDAMITGDNDTEPTPAEIVQITSFMQDYVKDFVDNDAMAHVIAVPPPHPSCSGGGGQVGHGWFDLVSALGGQLGSLCQPDLGPTIDAIIDDIIGSASPIELEYVPISITIAVARDGVQVPRSRADGWDYRASANAIIFNNMPFDPANPSEVVVSYRRWAEQPGVE